MKKHCKKFILPISLSIIILISLIIVNYSDINAQDLSSMVKSNNISSEKLPETFLRSNTNFSITLFKNSVRQNTNTLISPVSVSLALGMTANGAGGNTLSEFQKLWNSGKLTIDQLNKFNYTLASILQNDNTNKIRIANSIWYRNDKTLAVKPSFIQKNVDFYKAQIYKSDFNSKETVKDINNWVKKNTDGMVDKMVETINPNTIMYLFNTVLFNAEWDNIYKSNDVYDGIFSVSGGASVGVLYMQSQEKYLSGKSAEGFLKPYKGGKYSFIGILPKENISLDEYVNALDDKSFSEFINSYREEYARISVPKFKYEYSISMVEPLKAMGLTDSFIPSRANFTNMASAMEENIYIADVLHKSFIQFDEKGTKAGAATKVEMACGAAMQEPKSIVFDRPFLFTIIENETQLPLFIGTVTHPKK